MGMAQEALTELRDAMNPQDPQTTPTEAAPCFGASSLIVGREKITLSEGAWWLDDSGDYVIRSLEFDVTAAGNTFEEALARFNRDVLGYAVYLGELDTRAENEEEMFHLLAPRMLRMVTAAENAERKQRRLITINLHRRRSREQWHPSSRQRGSRLPSPA